jgi:3-hydroxybutyryl-CoA dehydrogenase
MQLDRVGVIGAGTRGNGIAQACATTGIDVTMVDVAQAAIDRGLGAIRGSLERLEKKEKITAEARAAAVSRIEGTTDYGTLARCGIIVEAATENLELKLRILKQIDAIARPDAILASNTSSISITQLAAVVAHPERFVGMHFFNPVPLMALVEVIRGLQTSDETLATVNAVAEKLGKTPVEVNDYAGFVSNRVLMPAVRD